MIILPIVERELRVGARRNHTYIARFSAALMAVLFGVWIILTFNQLGFSRAGGQGLFSTFTNAALLYCLVAGVRNASDCVSEEKRGGTLGLLFLTNLHGYDIALGKLLAVSLNSFYALLATFPVLGISLLLGGVTAGEFWLTTLALLNAILFSHAAGLLISILSHGAQRAAFGAVGLVLLFVLIFPLLGTWLEALQPGLRINQVFKILSPGYAFSMASGATLHLRANDFWPSLLLTHLIGWGFLALASWFLPRVWQEKVTSARRLRWRERWRQWCYGKPVARVALRRRFLDINPFFWLVNRDRLKPYYIWMFLAGAAAVWSWLWLRGASPRFPVPFFILSAITLHTVLKFWVASEASQHIEQERRSGAFEVLFACTPLSVAEILRGQLLAVRRLFAWPVVAVLGADLLMLVLGAQNLENNQVGGLSVRGAWVLTFLAGMGMFVADVIALAWVGMWTGISASKQRRASGQALGRVLVAPWVYFYLLAMVLHFSKLDLKPEFVFDLGLWFGLGIFNDMILILHSRRRLHRDFRALARLQFGEEAMSPLGRLGRWLGRWTRRRRRAIRPNRTPPPLPPMISSGA